jgi:hypothetical protein
VCGIDVGRVSLGENTNKLGGTVIVAGECFELNKISLTALKLKVTRFQTLSPCSPSLVRLSRINLTCHNLIYRPHHHKSVAVINTTAEIFTRTSPPPTSRPRPGSPIRARSPEETARKSIVNNYRSWCDLYRIRENSTRNDPSSGKALKLLNAAPRNGERTETERREFNRFSVDLLMWPPALFDEGFENFPGSQICFNLLDELTYLGNY